VASTCIESGGEIVLLDPVAPTQEGSKLWSRLDARPPTLIMVLKPDHVRDGRISWLFSKARAKCPYLNHTGRGSNAEKQPTGQGPEGCDENGPAAALLLGRCLHLPFG
jgi:hypothetical protein